jgi:hypothetical protein
MDKTTLEKALRETLAKFNSVGKKVAGVMIRC